MTKDTTRPALLAALAFFIFRLWYVTQIQLSPDEAYYWEWSRSLDLSYYDQGPMLALAIWLGTRIAGPNELGVRLLSVAAGLVSSGLAVLIARRVLKRPEVALWLVLALNTVLLFSVGAILMMHDSLMGFFWMLGLTAALLALEESRYWLMAGFFGGAAILSKYTGVLFFAGVLLALCSHPGLRPQLRSPWLWLGALLGSVLGLAPILYWNAIHQWPSMQHVASLAGGDSSRRSLSTVPEFLGSQFGLITPLVWLGVLGAWWRYRQPRRASPSQWLLWCLGAAPFLFFAVLSLRTRIEGNWPAQAYLAGLLLLATDLDPASKFARRALALAAFMALLVHVQAIAPFLPIPQSRFKMDTAARLDGWRQLADAVETQRSQLSPGSFVACRTYQNAAELAFYLPGQPRSLIIQNGEINHQYRFWNPSTGSGLDGRDAVIVTGQDWEVDEMRPHFRSLEAQSVVETRRNGIVVQTYRLYRAKGFKP